MKKPDFPKSRGNSSLREILFVLAAFVILVGAAVTVGLLQGNAFKESWAPPEGTGNQRPAKLPGGVPHQPPVTAHAAGTRPDPLLAREGEQTYNAFCVACHQPEATGKVGFAPSIRNRDFVALASDDFIRNTIRMGRPGTAMVSWAHLSDRQIDGIIAYLHTARDYQHVDIPVDPNRKHPGDALEGRTTYLTYCAACHGADGSGYAAGGSGPGIGLAGFLAVASDDYIFQTVKHGRIGTPMRSFMGPEGLANLSEEEIGNVIAYLRTLKPGTEIAALTAGEQSTGEQHFNINCVACHQSGGVGKTGFAPSIRNRDFLAIASDDFIRQTIRSGRPGTAMLARPDLSDEVVTGIISYLRSAPVANAVVIEVDPARKYPGSAADGHEKFNLYCAACHGPKGTGYASGGSGPAIGLTGFLSAASDDYIFQTVRHGRIGTAMRPFMGPEGIANLSEKDVSDIISFLRTLN